MYIDCPLDLNSDSTSFDEFEGYASIFGVVDRQDDVILKGSFADTLKGNEVKLLWQHKHDNPIGKIIQIEEDDKGLYVKGKLLNSLIKGKEAVELLRSQSINGLSIGYTPIQYHFDKKTALRIITKLKLWEISLVTFPANPKAKVFNIKNDCDKIKESIDKAKNILKC